jgi:hypothetical protein
VVAGLIADHAARAGLSVAQAAQEVLDRARGQVVEGVGPALTVEQ